MRPPLTRQAGLEAPPLTLAGFSVPTFIFPAWLQQSTLVPVRWAMEDFDATTWRGIGLSGAVVSAIVLIGFAATFSCVAVSRFGGQSLTKS
jgi:ABC-type multidrug transport system permease subunit